MRIYTYFAPLPSIHAQNERALIHLWESNWAGRGYEPVVLGPEHAQRHPLYKEFRDRILTFPTPNPKGYDEACWLRWLAFADRREEIILAGDYDVFTYGFDPRPESDPERINLYARCVPCLVYARPDLLGEACRFMMQSEPGPEDHFHGTPIYEDQHWFRATLRTMPSMFKVSHQVREYTEPGWEAAPAVHFCNNVMPAFRPRFRHIPLLRGW